MLPATGDVPIAPGVEQVVLTMVSIDILGGVLVIVGITCPTGTASVAPTDCSKRTIGWSIRLEEEQVVLLSPKSEEERANNAVENRPGVVLEPVLAAVLLEVLRAMPLD